MNGFVLLAIIIGTFAMIPVGIVLNGWALSILWGWFMVPLGLPALSVPTAIGLALVVSYMTHQYDADQAKDESKSGGERLTQALLYTSLKPFFALGAGWIIKQFL